MEGKFQKFSYHDLDIWLIFQNVDGKNEFISLTFMFPLLWSLKVSAGDSKKSIKSIKSIKIIEFFQKMLSTRRVLDYHFMRSWSVKYWQNPESASIYQMSVTSIVVIFLMVVQNPITCIVFGKGSTRSFRCTYKLRLRPQFVDTLFIVRRTHNLIQR